MKKSLSGLSPETLSGACVTVRVDFNVPLDGEGEVADPIRIERALPTLEYLRGAGARTVVLSHFGRPKGEPVPEFSLAPVARYLTSRLGGGVRFLPTTVGPDVSEAVAGLENGDVLLLENTRFLPGETTNDPNLAAKWAAFTDVFVNDAFGAAHRAHASTQGLSKEVQKRGGLAVAGFLMEKELAFLGGALQSPERPFVAILGGAKISGKIDVIEALLPHVDALLIGGAMANTFFGAMGLETGESLVEEDRYDTARDLLERGGDRLILPVDCVVGDRIAPDAAVRTVNRSEVQSGDVIGDVGEATVAAYSTILEGAKTIIWNGPMGVFEMTPYSEGTFGIAKVAAQRSQDGATVILGGGDSAAAAEAAGLAEQMTHISTGGGASLEFLAGKELPGVAALTDETND